MTNLGSKIIMTTLGGVAVFAGTLFVLTERTSQTAIHVKYTASSGKLVGEIRNLYNDINKLEKNTIKLNSQIGQLSKWVSGQNHSTTTSVNSPSGNLNSSVSTANIPLPPVSVHTVTGASGTRY